VTATLSAPIEAEPKQRAQAIWSSPVMGTILGVLAVVAVWAAVAPLHRLIPSPVEALRSVAGSWSAGMLSGHVTWTLTITVQGFLIAAAVGITAGLLIGLNSAVKAVLGDMVYAASSVPKLVLFPILLVLFGLGWVPEMLFVALSGVFLITIQVMTGCGDILLAHRRVGQVFRASGDQMLCKIYLPTIAPSMVAGLRLGFSMGLVHAVLAEMALGSDGIGYLIWTSYRNLDMGLLYGLVFIVSVFAIMVNLGFYYIEKRLRGGSIHLV
jgi:NitT/TauT family transport system permease protein